MAARNSERLCRIGEECTRQKGHQRQHIEIDPVGARQAAGTRLDPAKWTFEIGNLKVNNEVEIYCPGYPSDKEQSKPRFDAGWQEISVCDPKDGSVSFDGEGAPTSQCIAGYAVTSVSIEEACGHNKLVDPQSELVRVAKATGVCFGDEPPGRFAGRTPAARG